MRPASTALKQAVRADHQIAVEVDVLSNGYVIAAALPVSDGSVTLDRTAAVRGRVDLTIPDMVPSTAKSLLAVYGNELAVWRGVKYGDGTKEMIRLGIFRIDTADSTEPGRAVRITGQDRSATVSDARLEAPYVQAAGVNYATAVQNLIAAGGGFFGFQLSIPTFTTPAVVVQEQADRWATAQSWVQAYGHEIYFNGDGVCVSFSEPSLLGIPVYSIDEGPGGVLVDVSTGWDRVGIYNRVIAVGSNPSASAIYRGVATDNDPSSPTFYGGGFGRVPTFYDSPLISSDAMAQSSADSVLRRVLGQTQAVRFDSVVLPFLEPGDLINVTRASLPINADAHLIETLTIPLTAGGVMSGTTRTRRSV